MCQAILRMAYATGHFAWGVVAFSVVTTTSRCSSHGVRGGTLNPTREQYARSASHT
jgi:hypothetical protein